MMNWTLNLMEDVMASGFHYCRTDQELWDSITSTYAHKKKNAQIYPLTKEIVQIKPKGLFLGNYYVKL